jgi:Fur family peroxide stress response transcriptional regulator
LLANPEARLEELITKLKELGYRLTPQRIAVLRILSTSEGHPSVECIYNQIKVDFPTTSLGTVYKTVSLLKEMGEVLELGFADDSNRYDGNNPYPHPHLICVKCKNILDPDIPDLSMSTRKVITSTGYQIVNYRFDIYGVCPDCQEKEPA